VIRDAVLHLDGEQPLLGDIYRLPEPTDSGLLCTNVRTLDGRRPVFIDRTDSVFFFPYRIMRFIEIPGAASRAGDEGAAVDVVVEPVAGSSDGHDTDLELDEDFLRRVREI
jgi:hypothetical protein